MLGFAAAADEDTDRLTRYRLGRKNTRDVGFTRHTAMLIQIAGIELAAGHK